MLSPQFRLISAYNRSVKMMFDLPFASHRYIVEPLTGRPHLSFLLYPRFLSFTEMVKKPKKKPLKALLDITKSDCRSITGSNFRKIMLLSGQFSFDDIDINNYQYMPIPEGDAWRIDFIKEILESKYSLTVENMDESDMDAILDLVCTQ